MNFRVSFFSAFIKYLKDFLSNIFFCGILTALFLFLFSFSAFNQEISYDNIRSTWTNNSSWTDGTNPGVSTINNNTEIYGTISRWGNLDFNNGDLTVHDTLIIYGDLSLGNNADLTISDGGVLLVNGNYTSGNQVIALAGGYFVV
ncbi:MAG: hypothetical protein ACP5E3_17835, partial [Bacteroidales bacterium]